MVAKPVTVGVVGVIVLASALVLNYFVLPGEETEPATKVAAPVAPPAAPPRQPDKVERPAAAGDAGKAAGPAEPAGSAAPSAPPAVAETPPRPSFDVVRVDPDGNTVIAGRGTPNTEIAIVDGDREIGRVTSDDRGEWVFVPPSKLSPGQRVLSLRELGDGKAESSEAVVLVIPEKGKDIAGRPAAEPGVPLAVVVPKEEGDGRRVAARVLQAPAAGPLDTAAASASASASAGASQPAGPAATRSAGTEASAGRLAAAEPTASPPTASPPPTALQPSGTASSTAAAAAPGTGKAGAPPDIASTIPSPAGQPSTGVASGSPSGVQTGGTAAGGVAGDAAPSRQPGGPAATGSAASAVAASAARSAPGSVRLEAAPSPGAAPAAVVPGPATAPSAAPAAAPEPAAGPAEPSQLASAAPVVSAYPEAGPTAPADAAAEAGKAVAVDVIDYDDKGDVVFSGRAEPGSRVEVFIDDRKVGDTGADTEGRWTMRPAEPVAPGSYQLRVDKVAPSGTVQARVAFPFVRADPLTDLPNNRLVVIQPGNNLWRIATRVYGSGFRYVEIFDANKDQILDPDLIYPGQVFGLPRVN